MNKLLKGQKWLLIVLMALTVVAIQSCKSGCRDKKAINYNSKAGVENGSCLYCTSTNNGDTGVYQFFISNAPNPNVPAVEFIVIGQQQIAYGNDCNKLGIFTDSTCATYLKMVNLTNKNVSGFVDVLFENNGFDQWAFNSNNISLGPHGGNSDTLNFGNVNSGACTNTTTGTLFFESSNDLSFN